MLVATEKYIRETRMIIILIGLKVYTRGWEKWWGKNNAGRREIFEEGWKMPNGNKDVKKLEKIINDKNTEDSKSRQ